MTNDRLFFSLAAIATILAAVSAMGAWIVPGTYDADPAVIRPQLYGQDLVTLLAAAMLVVAMRSTARGSTRGRIILLGGMLYLAYGAMMYAFGVRFNAFFLVYVATMSAATFALALGVARFPVGELRGRTPWRGSLAAFFVFIPLMFGTLWLIDILGAYASGTIPRGAQEVQMPTSPVHVQDLGFVLPLSAATAVLLLRRNAWAPVFTGIMLVKTITICLAMLAMGLMAWRLDQPLNVPVAAAALLTLAIAAALSWGFFRSLPRRPAPATRPTMPHLAGGG